MRTKLLVPSFVMAILCSAAPASASLIAYDFSGTVTDVYGDLSTYLPGIDVSTPLTGRLTYDPAIGYQDPLVTGFNVTALHVQVGDFDITARYPNGSPGYFWWSGLYIFQIDGPTSPFLISDYLWIQWNAADPTGNPGALYVQGLASDDDMRGQAFSASIQQFTAVPDVGAGSGFLLLLGLSGIHAARRFRFDRVRIPR